MGWPGGGRRGQCTTPGKILTDLVTTLALGGDCLADIAVLRAQSGLAGPVASDPVVSRLVTALAADAPRALRAIRAARTAARERAWALAGDRAPGGDGSLVPVDLDATIVLARSPAPRDVEEDVRVPAAGRSPATAPGPAGKRWPSCCGPGTPGRTWPASTSG